MRQEVLDVKNEVLRWYLHLENLKKNVENTEEELEKRKKRLQELCEHDDEKEAVFEGYFRDVYKQENVAVIKGWICNICEKFLPSRVWGSGSRLLITKFCVKCDGEVEADGRSGSTTNSDRAEHYKCKVCGHKQSVWIG